MTPEPVSLEWFARSINAVLAASGLYTSDLRARQSSRATLSLLVYVLDFYQGDSEPLFPGLGKAKFTFQLSDHLPLWMQMNTDIDGVQLDQIIRTRSVRKPR